MTVSISDSKKQYSGDGSTVAFAVIFYFIQDSEVKATKKDVNGVETLFVLGTDYTLTGAGNLDGGTLTTTATLTSSDTITIERDVAYTQSTDNEPYAKISAETLEQNLDKLTMLAQQVKGLTDRAPKLPTTTTNDPSMEEASSGEYLKWDASGNIINGGNTVTELGNYTYPHVSAVQRTLAAKVSDVFSVKDFGAVGDGVTDDTAAIQLCLDAAKGADGTGVGRSIFAIHFPGTVSGFYKITDTLVIDGTHGLVIYGDGNLSERGQEDAVLKWYGTSSKPMIQIKGQTGALSNPNTLITIRDLTISGYASQITPASVPADMALSAIHIGHIDGFNDDSLARQVLLENVSIANCRFGIWSGSPDAQNTDHAKVSIVHCFITNNSQHGVFWGNANTLGLLDSCYVANNGWASASHPADDYSAQVGTNVYVISGYFDIMSYSSAGKDTLQPDDADIYQSSGRVSILNAWSDTHGFFFYQASVSVNESGRHVGQISGVRHYEGSMAVGNTPTSMYITGPGTVVSSCMVYGDIQVVSGISGRPIFIGINFCNTSTFVGTGIDTQRSLINIGSAGNEAQVTMGGRDTGVSLAHVGSAVPALLSLGQDNNARALFQAIGAASTDSGTTLMFSKADGAWVILMNCYNYDASGNMRAHKAGMAYRIVIGSTSTKVFRIFGYEFADTSTSKLEADFTDMGGFIGGGSAGKFTEASIQAPHLAADPTYSSGDHWEGSIYYNTATNKLRVNTGASTWVDLH